MSASTDPQAQKTPRAFLIAFDGKEQPFTGLPPTDKLRWTHKGIDERTYEFVAKVNGQVTTTSRVVMSRDGKTRPKRKRR